MFDHGLGVRLCLPHSVLEVVDILAVTGTVDLHRLEEKRELLVAGLPVDAGNVRELHRAGAKVTQADDQQVDQVLQRDEVRSLWLQSSDQLDAERAR